MSVKEINNVSQINTFNNNNSKMHSLDTPTETKQKSNGTKLLLGSLAALAIGGAIYVATHGKKDVKAVTQNAPVEELKEFTLEAFKQAGNKFAKGQALLANGEKYSGEMIKNYKDGTKVILEYTDGLLQKSTKSKNGEKVFEKIYKYTDDLKLKSIDKDRKNILNKSIDMFGRSKIDNSKSVVTKKDNLINVYNLESKQEKLYIDKKLRYKSDDKYYEYYDEAGKVFAQKGPDVPECKAFSGGITDSTGLIWNGSHFFEPNSKTMGHFNYHVNWPLDGSPDYKPVIKGIDLSLASSNQVNLKKNTAILHHGYNSTINTSGTTNTFYIDHRYDFSGPNKYKKILEEIRARFGDYKHLAFDLKTGTVSNRENKVITPLFKYDPRTKQISDLAIDKDEAMKIIEFGEEQYKIFKTALASRRNIGNASDILKKSSCTG